MSFTKVSVAGIGTTGTITFTNVNAAGVITATDATFSGNVSVGGTLTYEDVTNVDSVGLVTARSGILVTGGGGINLSGGAGVVTATTYRVGTAATLDASGLSVSAGVVTTTTLRIAAGSAAAPSITPTGDSNTGIFFPSADTIAFGEGGSEAARIDSSGRFGLGTSSPSQLLHVAGASQFGGNLNGSSGATGTLTLQSTSGNNNHSRIEIGADIGSDNGGITLFTAGSSVATARMRISGTSGNVGIGSTSPIAKLHIGGVSAVTDTAIYIPTGGIQGDNAGVFEIANVGDTTSQLKLNTRGTLTFFRTSSGSLGGGSEMARFDSSGRLLVGTSSSAGGSGSTQYATFQVRGNTGSAGEAGLISLQRGETGSSVANGEALGAVLFASSDGAEFASIIARGDGTSGSNDYPGRIEFSTTADGASSPTERMRIRQNGFTKISSTGSYAADAGLYHEIRSGTNDNIALYVTHAGASGNQYGIEINTANDQNDSTRYFLQCSGGNTNRAKILSNGGLTNYQANNVNLSDINTKKDISPAAGTWDCIKEWEIVNYRYKDQPDDADLNLGVIAQQVAEGCPEVIAVFQEAKEATETEPAQEERLGVKEQQMYWMAIKALQEAQVRIEQLEAKVAALEAQ